MLYFKIKR